MRNFSKCVEMPQDYWRLKAGAFTTEGTENFTEYTEKIQKA